VSRAAGLLEIVARALADQPDRVKVVRSDHRGTVLLELFMAPGDLGHVIGRQGRTATAIRTLAAVTGERDGERIQVEFRDGNGDE
jgi:predicted RNA-binding protein YlqC (UPF0109 family)